VARLPLIYNPAAHAGRGRRIAADVEARLLARGHDLEVHATTAPMDAARLVRELAAAGHQRIAVLGGDGTLSEAAHGVLDHHLDITLVPLPGGTGNALLDHFGLPNLDEAVRGLDARQDVRIDAGRVTWPGGQRWTINVFGTGFLARVATTANRRLKWLGGSSYTWAVFPELIRLRAPPTRLTLDGIVQDGDYSLVAVCNTSITGRGMIIAPEADASDGKLDIIALRGGGRARLLRLFPKIFDGTHVESPHVFVAQAARVKIEPTRDSPLLGDGEVYGTTPVEVEVHAAALKMALPPSND